MSGFKAKFERSSFGTPSSVAARRSVSTQAAARVVARSAQIKKGSGKSGGK